MISVKYLTHMITLLSLMLSCFTCFNDNYDTYSFEKVFPGSTEACIKTKKSLDPLQEEVLSKYVQ